MKPEKRAHRRYPLRFPISVQMHAAGPCDMAETECVEISHGGLTLGCDDVLIGALLEQEQYPRTCTLVFSLPGCPQRFEVDCQIVRHRRLSRSLFHLVALFREFRVGNAESLADYLIHSDPNDTAWQRAASGRGRCAVDATHASE